MRAFRPIALGFVVAVTCAGGVAAGSAMAPDGPDFEATGPALVEARPGSERIGALTEDPSDGLGWAVRSYTSMNGNQCLEAQRYDGRSFGRRGVEGEVKNQPADSAGACVVSGSHEPVEPALNRYPETSAQKARTAVFGMTFEEVERLEVIVGGRRTGLLIAEDGTFLLVLPGVRDPQSLPIVATLRGGEQRLYDWR